MTATEELRRLLDERGVEYDKAATVIGETVATFWHDRDGYLCSAIEGADDIPDGEVSLQAPMTPAQAIAATLGDVPHLPYLWTHDGTLHIELPKLPESISVRLPEQRDREVYSARVWQYTLGSGTCHEVEDDDTGFIVCSECGAVHDESYTSYYCWCCGRKVVDE